MELKLNYSQDIVTLQTKYSLFKRVLNIVFSLTIDGGFDRALMTNAINKVIERNDCLRIRFFKKGKETLQTIDAERNSSLSGGLFMLWAFSSGLKRLSFSQWTASTPL